MLCSSRSALQWFQMINKASQMPSVHEWDSIKMLVFCVFCVIKFTDLHLLSLNWCVVNNEVCANEIWLNAFYFWLSFWAWSYPGFDIICWAWSCPGIIEILGSTCCCYAVHNTFCTIFVRFYNE